MLIGGPNWPWVVDYVAQLQDDLTVKSVGQVGEAVSVEVCYRHHNSNILAGWSYDGLRRRELTGVLRVAVKNGIAVSYT